MWIVNKYGVAINTNCVARFREDGGMVVADLKGMPPMSTPTIVGDTTITAILENLVSGTKIMEVR